MKKQSLISCDEPFRHSSQQLLRLLYMHLSHIVCTGSIRCCMVCLRIYPGRRSLHREPSYLMCCAMSCGTIWHGIATQHSRCKRIDVHMAQHIQWEQQRHKAHTDIYTQTRQSNCNCVPASSFPVALSPSPDHRWNVDCVTPEHTNAKTIDNTYSNYFHFHIRDETDHPTTWCNAI